MTKRTTIEIDGELLARAKRALGSRTTRGTVEESILALHGDKRRLVADVLDGSDAAAKLSVDDLVALIRGGTQASADQESE